MNAAVTASLALIQQLLPLIPAGDTGIVGTAIKALQTWMPIVVTEIDTLYDPVKEIITALRTKDLTQDQIDTLKRLDLKTDAAFEAAAEALGLEDTE